jgi:hypothetical protein
MSCSSPPENALSREHAYRRASTQHNRAHNIEAAARVPPVRAPASAKSRSPRRIGRSCCRPHFRSVDIAPEMRRNQQCSLAGLPQPTVTPGVQQAGFARFLPLRIPRWSGPEDGGPGVDQGCGVMAMMVISSFSGP